MSNLDTAKAVLAKASLFDQTFATPDLGIAVAWSEALGPLAKDDACAAVTDHYQAQTRRLMPADVLAGVKRIRAERLREVPLEPVYDGDVRRGLQAIKAHRRAVGDGRGLEAVPDYPKRDVEGLLERAVDALPPIPKPDYAEKRARFNADGTPVSGSSAVGAK